MKVLFDHPQPFFLAHGGFQNQIEQTRLALQNIGLEVEHVRWWDDSQRGDLIHYFSRVPPGYVDLAHRKNMKVIMSELLSSAGARPVVYRVAHEILLRVLRGFAPAELTMRMAWDSFRMADASIALTSGEAGLMTKIFQAPPERVYVVPNGVESVFLEASETTRGPWLVCTATIRELKRVLELAKAAAHAERPVWIIGKPYGQEDAYAARFLRFVKEHRDLVRYEGAIGDRRKLAQIYRESRGFVLLSTNESLSLSALEASACGCPLLLSDLPWARTVFREYASYCPVPASVRRTGAHLKRFYDEAPKLPIPAKPPSWVEVAKALKSVYERVLGPSKV